MRRYQFRMQKLLKLKEHQEKLQRIDTLRKEQEVQRSLDFRNALRMEAFQIREEMDPGQGNQVLGVALHEYYRYLVRLNQESFLAEKELIERTEELRQKRLILVERSREKKTMERLKGRDQERWAYETRSEEQKEMDDIGITQKVRQKEHGGILLSGILMVLCLALGVSCFLVWNNWLKKGEIGADFLNSPFEQMADKKVKQELATYEHQQRLNREKRDQKELERAVLHPETETDQGEEDGFKNTMQRILQKEDALKKKEEALDARENSIQVAQEDLKREINRLNNLQKRISVELDQLKDIEARRKAEMSTEKKKRLEDLNLSVKAMSPKRAADLLLGVSFPDPKSTLPSPLPLGEDLEGIELAITVMNSISNKDRGEILDAMVKISPEKAAVLFNRLDNVRTGLEEDRFFNTAHKIPG